MMKRKLFKWIVCVVVDKKGHVLLLKRVSDKKYYPNYWAPIAGGFLPEESKEEAAKREVFEETGKKMNITKAFKGRIIKQENRKSFVYPFLFVVGSKFKNLKINHEHSSYKWVKLSQLSQYNLVPGLERAIVKMTEKV